MASLGKKILGAFIEVKPDQDGDGGDAAHGRNAMSESDSERGNLANSGDAGRGRNTAGGGDTNKGGFSPAGESLAGASRPESGDKGNRIPSTDNRFSDYFDKLFREANLPGPDYYEFAAMVQALGAVPDESARYLAAFAGLQVQGLEKEKLLSTAAQYLKILETDAGMFHQTVDAAVQEKVHARRQEMEEKHRRMQELSKEIADLQRQIGQLEGEVRESEEKIEARNAAYVSESAERSTRIQSDIQKIKNYLR